MPTIVAEVFFVLFIGPKRQMLEYCFKVDDNCSFLCPSQFIIHDHSAIWCSSFVLGKKDLNIICIDLGPY
jgi:hypothetical protein